MFNNRKNQIAKRLRQNRLPLKRENIDKRRGKSTDMNITTHCFVLYYLWGGIPFFSTAENAKFTRVRRDYPL